MRYCGKVVFLLPGFPANSEDRNCFPYIQDFLIEMLESSQPQNYNAIGIHYPFEACEYYWNGMKVDATGGKNRSGFSKLITWLKVLRLLYKLHRKTGIDIIHVFWLNEPALLAQIFSWIVPVKIVVTVPGQDAKKTNKYLHFLNLHKIHVCGLSHFVINELQKHQRLNNFSVIPCGIRGIDLEIADQSIEGFEILGVGNIYPLKNYSLFLDVIKIVRKNRPEIKAAIIGWGESELEFLKEKCKKYNLENNVRFLGELDHNIVLAIMSKSKIFLHTSSYEGQGFVFTEALSQGMVPVSTPVADNEIITGIFTANNADSLAMLVSEKLSTFNRNPKILKSAAETAEDYFNLYQNLS